MFPVKCLIQYKHFDMALDALAYDLLYLAASVAHAHRLCVLALLVYWWVSLAPLMPRSIPQVQEI